MCLASVPLCKLYGGPPAMVREISRRALDLFLKSLDGRKLYFYQSDVDEFHQRRNDLDDMINAGDVSFAYTVFNRLLKRVDERITLVNELLKSDLDFQADETLITDPDKLTYPVTPDEATNLAINHINGDPNDSFVTDNSAEGLFSKDNRLVGDLEVGDHAYIYNHPLYKVFKPVGSWSGWRHSTR